MPATHISGMRLSRLHLEHLEDGSDVTRTTAYGFSILEL
jgi:hypothetical protein